LLCYSCKTTKKVPTKRPNIVDNKKDTKNSNSTPVDSVNWTKENKKKNPPISDTKDAGTNPYVNLENELGEVKSSYQIALFIPLSKNSGNSDNKYLKYYAGMKLAADAMKANGVSINIDVKDADRISSLSTSEEYDVVIAPNDKDIVTNLIDYGKETKTLVISPWYSNSKVTSDNSYYLQLTPNVREHFIKMIDHISQNFESNEVALVGLENNKYNKWFRFLQGIGKAYYNEPSPFYEHFVQSDSLALGEEVFINQIEEGIKVFVIPNYGSRDENHTYSVLRRINAEKASNTVYVYGMPLMIQSDRINYDYYANLNMRVVVSEHIDLDDPKIKNFRSKYFYNYKDLPSIEAYEGHDLLNLISEGLSEFGTGFSKSLSGDVRSYLQTSYDIQAVNIDNENLEASDKIDFYENKHLDVVEFIDGKFRKN
jgi:hypothetical protein